MPQVENFKTVTLYGSLTSGSSFNKSIYLEFQPDEVVVKSFCFSMSIDSPILISSDLINNEILLVIPDNYSETSTTGTGTLGVSNLSYDSIGETYTPCFSFNVNTPHKITKPVQGQYTFNCKNYDNTDSTLSGVYTITITFVKYKNSQYTI